MLEALYSAPRAWSEHSDEKDTIAEGLPVQQPAPCRAYITIMYGCNNFCSYCIVPYVRGPGAFPREIERALSAEARRTASRQRREGNHAAGAEREQLRQWTLENEPSRFAQLLKAELDEVGIPRIRFMTSHPKDLVR